MSSSSDAPSINVDSGTEAPDDIEGKLVSVDREKKFYKVILTRGSGMEKPGTIDEVTLRWGDGELALEDLPPAQSLLMGEGLLSSGLEMLVTSMRLEEVCESTIPEELNDGERKKVKVQLLAFTHRYDLLGDKALIKRRTKKGFGYEHADLKDDVTFSIQVTAQPSNTSLYSATSLKEVMEPDRISEGTFQVLKSMKLHEEAEVAVQKDYFQANFQAYGSLGPDDTHAVLTITLCDMAKIEDLYLDGTFYKRTLINGSGKNIPNTNAHLRVYYKLEANNRTLIDNFGLEPLAIILDEDEVPSLWTHCFRQMKEGDRFLVEGNLMGLHGQNASDGLDPRFNLETYPDIGNSMTLMLELISFDMVPATQGKTNYNFAMPERADEATRIKEAGIKLFKVTPNQKGYFERALEKFEAAASTLQPLRDDPYLFNPIHYNLQHNISVCHLKMKNWHEVENFCNKILEINPEDVKALYRRGVSRRELWNYDAALSDFSTAKGVMEVKGETGEGNYKEICAEWQKTKKLEREANVKEKELFKNVFSVL